MSKLLTAVVVVLHILQQLRDINATKRGLFCEDASEIPILVQFVGYESSTAENLESVNNLRNTAKISKAVESIWELHYSLRERGAQQQRQLQYENIGEGVLSFGGSASAHSVCVPHDREHELLLKWANDDGVDQDEEATRPAGVSLCGGKYLVPIGRSILLSPTVLHDCTTSYNDAPKESVTGASESDENSSRRQLQDVPTSVPTAVPTETPSWACIPSSPPTVIPSGVPTQRPSEPTSVPTATPTVPTSLPSSMPTTPTSMPSSAPSRPTSHPTIVEDPNESEGSNSGGSSSSSSGDGAMAFFTSDAGYGTIAAAGVVGLGLLATGAYFLWQYSGDLVKAPLAPQELAMQI